MRRLFSYRSLILASLMLVSLGILSGCGGTSVDTSAPAQEDSKQLEDRQNQMKEQYSKQAPTTKK